MKLSYAFSCTLKWELFQFSLWYFNSFSIFVSGTCGTGSQLRKAEQSTVFAGHWLVNLAGLFRWMARWIGLVFFFFNWTKLIFFIWKFPPLFEPVNAVDIFQTYCAKREKTQSVTTRTDLELGWQEVSICRFGISQFSLSLLITLNYPVILSRRSSTTVSLETYPPLFIFFSFRSSISSNQPRNKWGNVHQSDNSTQMDNHRFKWCSHSTLPDWTGIESWTRCVHFPPQCNKS